MEKEKGSMSVFVFLAAAVAGADLLLKERTVKNMKPGEERRIFGGRLLYRRVHNPGFAMSRLKEYPKLVKGASLAAGAVLAAGWFRQRRQKGHLLEKAGLALMSGGAVGNGYDRLFRGYVVDYIGFPWEKESLRKITWNVADLALLAGGLLWGAASWLSGGKK